MAQVSGASAAVVDLPATFAPLQQGIWPNVMGSGGYSRSIGLLPEWDVAYLTSTAQATYKGVIFQAYSAGRYATHFRDESDLNRWARLSLYPTLQISRAPEAGYVTPPLVTGTAPPVFSVSHQPSVGFLAYLITGRRYFLDEVQAAESHNSMDDPATQRSNALGICDSAQAGTIRRVAWTAFRTLPQAISATPDADTVRLTEYRARFTNNVDWYHNKYVVVAPNIFGIVEPYETAGAYGNASVASTIWLGVMWMQDFLTAAMGYSKDLGLGLSAPTHTKLDALFTWKAQSIVGRLSAAGAATGAPYRAFAPYNWALCPAAANFSTGVGFYASWRAAFNATYSGAEASYTANNAPYASPGADVDGNLLNSLAADFQVAEAIPAIAYAVKHAVVGAAAAYQRLTTAGNWHELGNVMDIQPVFAVAPVALPRWRRGAVINTWLQITGTSHNGLTPTHTARLTTGAGSAGAPWLDAYNGFGTDQSTGKLWGVANGGHGDYYGNEIMRIDCMADAPAWQEWFFGSSGNVIKTGFNGFSTEYVRYLDDGISGALPASAHSYYSTQPILRHGRMLRTAGVSISPSGTGNVDTEAIRTGLAQSTNPWGVQFEYPAPFEAASGGFSGGGNTIRPPVCHDPRFDHIYVMSGNGYKRFTPSAAGPNGAAGSGGSWANMVGGVINSGPGFSLGFGEASAFDTRRGRMLVCGGGVAACSLYNADAGTGWSAVTLTGSGLSAWVAASHEGIGLAFVPQLDAYFARLGAAGSQILRIDAVTFVITLVAVTGGTSIPVTNLKGQGTANEGVYNRSPFLPGLRGLVYAARNSADLFHLPLY